MHLLKGDLIIREMSGIPGGVVREVQDDSLLLVNDAKDILEQTSMDHVVYYKMLWPTEDSEEYKRRILLALITGDRT